eukprot:TRINITY_DN1320_c0_g1_i5.p1 TRINITY_DN1320_c0_g1~~TRINITY_DN1320_c0_g1_i5.p1  ORF type:complete len:403 (+),score=103.65 TRINITY_DN1320_c0_g1_i5:2556-3764(+)
MVGPSSSAPLPPASTAAAKHNSRVSSRIRKFQLRAVLLRKLELKQYQKPPPEQLSSPASKANVNDIDAASLAIASAEPVVYDSTNISLVTAKVIGQMKDLNQLEEVVKLLDDDLKAKQDQKHALFMSLKRIILEENKAKAVANEQERFEKAKADAEDAAAVAASGGEVDGEIVAEDVMMMVDGGNVGGGADVDNGMEGLKDENDMSNQPGNEDEGDFNRSMEAERETFADSLSTAQAPAGGVHSGSSFQSRNGIGYSPPRSFSHHQQQQRARMMDQRFQSNRPPRISAAFSPTRAQYRQQGAPLMHERQHRITDPYPRRMTTPPPMHPSYSRGNQSPVYLNPQRNHLDAMRRGNYDRAPPVMSSRGRPRFSTHSRRGGQLAVTRGRGFDRVSRGRGRPRQYE